MEDWPELGRGLNDFGGDWVAYDDECYAIYYRDFYTTKPEWPDGKRFAIKRQPVIDDRCNTYWHIVSEGEEEGTRLPALSRAERIGWPRQVIDEFAELFPASSNDRLIWWKTERRAKNGSMETRIVLALVDFSYVVIVAERKDYVLLWTAFPVERNHQRGKLQRQCDAYWKGQGD